MLHGLWTQCVAILVWLAISTNFYSTPAVDRGGKKVVNVSAQFLFPLFLVRVFICVGRLACQCAAGAERTGVWRLGIPKATPDLKHVLFAPIKIYY